MRLTAADGGLPLLTDRSKANPHRGGRFSRRGPAAEDAAAELFGRRRGAAVARRRGALLRAVQGARVVLESMICNSEALLSLEPTHLSLDS